MATQLTGINAIIYYAPTIWSQVLDSIGLGSRGSSNLATVCSMNGTAELTVTSQTVIGLLNFLATIVAVVLVDRVGRKPLYISGMAVLTASNFLSGFSLLFANDAVQSYLVGSALIVFTIGFAISIGVVFWIYVFEIFTVEVGKIELFLHNNQLANSSETMGQRYALRLTSHSTWQSRLRSCRSNRRLEWDPCSWHLE